MAGWQNEEAGLQTPLRSLNSSNLYSALSGLKVLGGTESPSLPWPEIEQNWDKKWFFGRKLNRLETQNGCTTPPLLIDNKWQHSESLLDAVGSGSMVASASGRSQCSNPSSRTRALLGDSFDSSPNLPNGSPLTHCGAMQSHAKHAGGTASNKLLIANGSDSSGQGIEHMRSSSISLPASLPNDPGPERARAGPAGAPKASDTTPNGVVPAPAKQQQQVQPAVLGTWVNRQYRLLDPIEERERGPGHAHTRSQPDLIASAVDPFAPQQGADATNGIRAVHSQDDLQGNGDGPAGGSPTGRMSENGGAGDAAAEAAWRWRFARRWHAEQARVQDQDATGSCPDRTEEALQYLQAGGGTGWNMQVGITRTASAEASGMLFSVGTGTLGTGSLLAGEMLLEDGSYPTAPGMLSGSMRRGGGGALGRGDMLTATREVNSLNRRAAELLKQQSELEAAAEARWRASIAASGEAWIGDHLDTVEVDDWGTFRFLLLRVRGRNGDKQRVLLRGRNYCTEAQLVEDVNRKMMGIAARMGLALEPLEVMGGGVMEWRRDRDRHLYMHSGFLSPNVMPTAGKGAQSPSEILSLAAVLAKQSLPPHFKVSLDGNRI